MPDLRPPNDSAPQPAVPTRRLDSWKAIGDYLGRHVTTVQRWEHDESLPVHRLQHEKRGSVYAYTAELDAWLHSRRIGSSSEGSLPIVTIAFPDTGEVTERESRPVPWDELLSGGTEASSKEADPARAQPRRVDVTASQPRLRHQWLLWIAVGAAVGQITLAVPINSPSPSGDGDGVFSLAVLPLKNHSPDQQPDYLVDGMTEALTTDLASRTGVRVIALQSVMQYRDAGKRAPTIAKELGVSALVEGSVQQSGRQIRVDIRLIDGATGRSLWATAVVGDVGKTLALQAEISRAIVRELHLALDPSRSEQARRPTNSEAWDAYLRARFFWNRRTEADMSRAVEWYERAIQLDSSSPLIFAGLADVYATLGPPNTPVSEMISRGTSAAWRAITLDPLMGEAYAALGKLRAYGWDWPGAETSYRQAIERSPGYAPARYWFGSFLANQRRCDEALAQSREAERLDPVSLPGNMVVAGIELKCGRVEQAIRRSKTVLEFDPTFGPSYQTLGRAYLMRGDTSDAIEMLEQALRLSGGRSTTRAALAYTYAMAGRRREAEVIANELIALHTRDKVLAPAWSVAIAYAGLGNHDVTLKWLEHVYDDREEWLEALAADERFKILHSSDRFERLLLRLDFPTVAAVE